MTTEDRLKSIEENLAWLIKEIRELKKMRIIETHTYYTNIYNSMDIEEDEDLFY